MYKVFCWFDILFQYLTEQLLKNVDFLLLTEISNRKRPIVSILKNITFDRLTLFVQFLGRHTVKNHKLTVTVSCVRRWKPVSCNFVTSYSIVIHHWGLGLFGPLAVMRYRRNESSSRIRPVKGLAVSLRSEQFQCERHLAISEKLKKLVNRWWLTKKTNVPKKFSNSNQTGPRKN